MSCLGLGDVDDLEIGAALDRGPQDGASDAAGAVDGETGRRSCPAALPCTSHGVAISRSAPDAGESWAAVATA